jgi:asparagine synthase (glutamine-hydrolysing)
LSEVVPPFGLVVVDESSGSFAVCQDWLGMARLYVYRSQGVVAISNLPTMLPYVLGDRIVPDEEGWAYFIGGDAFNGCTSPVRGVTQVPAGVVMTGRQNSTGHWDVSTTQNRTVDDIVAEASAASDRTHIDLAAEGIRRAAASLGVLWPAQIPLGLSGGKDSRLVAAALLSAGIVPRFSTRADSPAEAERRHTWSSWPARLAPFGWITRSRSRSLPRSSLRTP